MVNIVKKASVWATFCIFAKIVGAKSLLGINYKY